MAYQLQQELAEEQEPQQDVQQLLEEPEQQQLAVDTVGQKCYLEWR
jgi:hypothetical protein